VTVFERFTQSARHVVVLAQQEARRLGHGYIGTEHLLLGLLMQEDEVGGRALRALGVTHESAAQQVLRLLGAGASITDADALAAIGIDLDTVRRVIEESFGPGALERRPTRRRRLRRRRRLWVSGRCHAIGGFVPLTPRAKKVLELSLRQALVLGDKHIGTEHVLLGLLTEGRGLAVRALRELGVDLSDVRAQVLARIGRVA
jgi:ATP-dependent Clp protease ATP-binding subunit ClpA